MKEVDRLTFLKGIYMNDELPLSVRMRAAVEVLPFTHPKLAVTAQVNEGDLAELPDRRLKRMEEKLLEHRPPVETKPAMPIAERRLRRI
jgi:hypothetical protein